MYYQRWEDIGESWSHFSPSFPPPEMQSNDVSFIDYRLERFSIVLGSHVSDVGYILHPCWPGLASVKVADNYILMVPRLFGLVNTFYCIIQDTRVVQ